MVVRYKLWTTRNIRGLLLKYFRYTLDDLQKSADRKLFTYISFFAGGGGSSAGYKLAGGDCLFVNEFQQVAVDTYLENWPETPHICDDIKNITGKQIMEMTGLKKYELDIMDGSPPCPPFSMSGSKRAGWGKEKMAYGMKQKNIEDLTWEMIRIAGEMMPKVIICENVKGLTMEYAADYRNRMVKDFEALGYSTVGKVLKGHEHGVPQKRERIFIVSVRDDVLDKIELPFMCLSSLFPDPSSEEPTIRDAIYDLKNDPQNIEEAEELTALMKDSSKGHWLYGFDTHPDYPGSGPCLGLRGINDFSSVVSIGDNIVKPWFRKQIEDGIISKEDEKHSYYMSRIVPWNQAAHSLTEQGLQPRFMGGNHMHPEEYRVYTPTEAKRLMTLPDDYKFHGTIDEKQARMGLMVAPLCMAALAERVYEEILEPYNA